MLLNVDVVTKSKSGKALRVKCGEDWYGARLNSGLDKLPKGATIDADVELEGDYGPQIEKWRQTSGAPAAPAKPNGATPTPTHVNGAAPVWANFVSNQVAHAIAAGRIDDPEQIKVWAAAAKTAFMELL